VSAGAAGWLLLLPPAKQGHAERNISYSQHATQATKQQSLQGPALYTIPQLHCPRAATAPRVVAHVMSAGAQSINQQGNRHAATLNLSSPIPYSNSQQPGCTLRRRLQEPAAAALGSCVPQGLQQPQACFSCHDSWHPKHPTSGWIYGHWKMHAAACQQPAAWLRNCGSAAAVAGCGSLWETAWPRAATAPSVLLLS